jgi:phage-related protein
MPHARRMPQVGPRCVELRVNDENVTWRIMLRVDSDAVVILEVFEKQSGKTPKQVLETCRDRLTRYDSLD